MTQKITWQVNGDNTDNINENNLRLISQWWSKLDQQKVSIAMRLIPPSGNVEEIDWDMPQKFDENTILESPEIRGITVYGKKQGEEKEFGYTAQRIELDLSQESLKLWLQSQANTIIRFATPVIKYDSLNLKNIEIVSNSAGKNQLVLVRDKDAKIEITFALNTNQQLYLLSQLAKNLKLNAKLNLSPETLREILELLQSE